MKGADGPCGSIKASSSLVSVTLVLRLLRLLILEMHLAASSMHVTTLL